MEVFSQVLHDMGYDLGWDNDKAQEAFKDVAELYREADDIYKFCQMKMVCHNFYLFTVKFF